MSAGFPEPLLAKVSQFADPVRLTPKALASEIDLSTLDAARHDLSGLNLSGLDLSSATLDNGDLSKTTLFNTQLPEHLRNVDFSRARMHSANDYLSPVEYETAHAAR